jgi:hypothetical protein
MARQGLAPQLAAGDIPESDGPIPAPGGEGLPIRAERHAPDESRMAAHHGDECWLRRHSGYQTASCLNSLVRPRSFQCQKQRKIQLRVAKLC